MNAYLELKKELEEIKKNHEIKFDGKGQDAVWVGVYLPASDWRKAKKMGLEKDYYYGYKLFSSSTNSMGYELYQAVIASVGKAQLDVKVFNRDL